MPEQNDQTPNDQTIETNSPDKNTNTSVDKNEKSIGSTKYYRELFEKEREEKAKLAAQVDEIKTSKLKEQNQWKELYEQEQSKNTDLSSKLNTISSALVEDKMRAAIEKEVLAAGILPSAIEDLDLVDKNMIEVETTSNGRINFHNVKEFVDSLKLKKPHWFGAGKDPNINNRRSDYAPPAELSAEQILELQTKDRAKYNDIMSKKLGRK